MTKLEFPEYMEKVDRISSEILHYLYENPELSSEEYNSSKFLIKVLRDGGFEVLENFLDMETSFIATHGTGSPKFCLFAEYDALPIGHACGHNVIAAWAVGTFIALAKNPEFKGTIILIGSPAEEGRGKYASSKIRIAPYLKELRVNAAFCIHPGDQWKVSGDYYARWRKSFTFFGKESHAAGSPEKGINALDAAVSFYSSVKALRNQLKADIPVIISEIIKEGGVAVNIVPALAEVWVDIRTLDTEYLDVVGRIVEDMGKGVSSAHNCSITIKELAPVTSSFRKNRELDVALYESAKDVIEELKHPDTEVGHPIGSSDIGNVSQVIPTSQLLVKIADEGTALHTKALLEAAKTDYARKAMIRAIRGVFLGIMKLAKQLSGP